MQTQRNAQLLIQNYVVTRLVTDAPTPEMIELDELHKTLQNIVHNSEDMSKDDEQLLGNYYRNNPPTSGKF